jgi:hypothetical protein
MTERDQEVDEAQASAPVVLTPPAGQDAIVSESRIEPRSPEHEADRGTKMFVLFFFLLVPPLGVVLLAAVVWSLYKQLMAT